MAGWLEFFVAVRVHVLVRFVMWDDLKKLAIPERIRSSVSDRHDALRKGHRIRRDARPGERRLLGRALPGSREARVV